MQYHRAAKQKTINIYIYIHKEEIIQKTKMKNKKQEKDTIKKNKTKIKSRCI